LTLQGEHQYTKAIQMAVQTAELQLIGVDYKEELHLSFSLMSISRGNCSIQVKPTTERQVGSVGWLKISADRPIMNGEFFLQRQNFDKIVNHFKVPSPRPVTVVIILNQDLLLSSIGDLILSEEKNLKILDISWILPLN
jgi:hypothetical protein